VLDRFHIMRNMNVAIDEVYRQEVVQLTTKNANGFRTPRDIEFALFHVMGNPPGPEFTPRFC
jgi:hypothetical protein